ncbi:MAG: ATP-binding protein [Myxococcales bacterium]|nr:ATP-binding protein [Myxococcales bacterium]
MKRSTRIERKILLAICVVALGPLLGAFVLGRAAIREAYLVGVSPRIGEGLERGVQVHRAYIVALRDSADRTIDAVAGSHRIHELLLGADRPGLAAHFERSLEVYPNLASIRVRIEGEWIEARREERLDPQQMRLLERTRVVEDLPGEPRLELVLAAPRAAFDQFQDAGDVAELHSRLRASSGYVSEVYLWVYFGLVVLFMAVALFFGIRLSRRVTRRVADLARATRKVGAGDLTVTVPTGATDEVAELTSAFNEMVRDLRESRERIDYLQRVGAWQEFARRLAHEIKNPLTPIQLAAQELHRSYPGEDAVYGSKLEEAVSIIEEEVATLRRLVGEFSSFAKLPEAILEDADLRDLIQDLRRAVPAILDDVGAEAEAVQVRFEAPTEPLLVRVDPMMLKRCLDNLLRNAVQAVLSGPRHGGLVRVEVVLEEPNVRVEIADDGPGIPPEDRRRVFLPYFTTKSEGTGLGLAIVKKVVFEHGGEILCAEAPEGGALFRILLPWGGR